MRTTGEVVVAVEAHATRTHNQTDLRLTAEMSHTLEGGTLCDNKMCVTGNSSPKPQHLAEKATKSTTGGSKAGLSEHSREA